MPTEPSGSLLLATVLRRLLQLGVEHDLAERYQRGELSLPEVATLLHCSLRDTLECLWRLGVPGNVSAEQALAALATLDRRFAPDTVARIQDPVCDS